MTAPAHEKPAGVSSIELFFDLVFVFVITQVTQLVEHAHGTMDFLRALLVLVLIAAMAGFLTMAMAIPEVFGAGALTFGLAYLFVVVLHLRAYRAAFESFVGLSRVAESAAAFGSSTTPGRVRASSGC